MIHLGRRHMLEGLNAIEFKDLGFLVLAPLAVLVVWVATRETSSIRFPTLAIAARTPATLRTRLRHLPAWLTGLAILCLIAALTGPRTGDEQTRVKTEGIAIMLVVDRSGSMDARDFVKGDYSVNRLDAVKQVLGEFVLGGNRSTLKSWKHLGRVSEQ